MRRFMEDEAELGSDNEENDDRRRAIKRDADEENEDGHDADLEDFVVHENDEDREIGSGDEAMREKFI